MSDRIARLEAIAEQVRVCTLCRLHEGATKAVPGAGDYNADIMFIGEGPGFNEDKTGLPFVGRSGDYLEKLLAAIGLKREQVFIANVVKHRPPENRDPLPDEMATCRAYLDEQELLIDPLVIATLGRFSMGRYFPNGKITQIHGKPKYEDRRAILPLFHPAAVLRNPTLEVSMLADFQRIPALVEEMRSRRAGAPPPVAKPPTRDDDNPPPPDRPTQLSLF
jgi:uracil-DNA glycosylase